MYYVLPGVARWNGIRLPLLLLPLLMHLEENQREGGCRCLGHTTDREEAISWVQLTGQTYLVQEVMQGIWLALEQRAQQLPRACMYAKQILGPQQLVKFAEKQDN